MARSALTKTTPTDISSDGTNLTDMTFVTMSTGSGNGVTFAFALHDLIVLKNDTGGAAVYTLVLPTITVVDDVGGSVTDPTVTVSDGKTHIFNPVSVLQQSDGNLYIDCDVAAKIAVVSLT